MEQEQEQEQTYVHVKHLEYWKERSCMNDSRINVRECYVLGYERLRKRKGKIVCFNL